MSYRKTFFVLSSGLVAACGGSSNFNAGVSNNQPLNDLTDQQAQEICENAEDFLVDVFDPQDMQDVQCTAEGIAAQVAAEAAGIGGVHCDQVRRACLDDNPSVDPPIVDGTLDCELVTGDEFASCDATVEQLEACINGFGNNVQAVRRVLDCGLVDDPDRDAVIQEALEDLEQDDVCVELGSNCQL